MSLHPVEGIPRVHEIEDDKSSYGKIRATTRFIFDCGVIWGLAYMTLRDEEYTNLSESAATKKTEKSINRFLKEGLKTVSKHDYNLPKIYSKHQTIIDFETDARVGGKESPFIKGVSFSGVFLKEFYQVKNRDWYIKINRMLTYLALAKLKETSAIPKHYKVTTN